MIRMNTKIILSMFFTFSIVLCGERVAGSNLVLTGKNAVSFPLKEGVNKRVVFEERSFSTNENDTIKKRSHKRRRKVRRPREGR